ncbi:distal tail protein Dit [Leuconostoc gasicomitatum]|uniref:distal tail protein Dit n=1 Tax=Leuconostoc gasicomitatum TaxID=115778 RepID=UPI0007E177F3|nr:distal tail protein Dit [Leuconostoc gasicomitatum]CUW06536.1 Phage protein [Leuconostoc gasicomitatum]
MATDITNQTLPNDNIKAPDSNFSNDTSLNGTEPSQMAYTEPSDGAKQLAAIDQEIKDNLYPDPEDDEFVVGRNYDNGAIGVNSRDLGIMVGHVSLPITPTISEMTQNVSGMYGQRWLGNNYGAKVFNIPVTVIATSADEYIKNVEQISNTLIQIGNTEVPLVFGAFPERTYYGHFTSIPEPAYIGQGAWDSTLTLQFTASDPHGYLVSEIGQADNQNKLDIMPLGNDIAKPIYQFNFTADSNNFGYVNSKGESVFVGFADDTNTKDLTPLVYNDPMEDPATFTKITDMSTQNWALANAQATADGTVGIFQGFAVRNNTFWTIPKDYTGQATMFGNVLLTKKFNVGATGDWRVSTRMQHARYYNRAYQRIEAYILGTDGHKIGRMGMRDYGTGGLNEVYVLFGKTVAEEEANRKNGFGYSGTGNTAWAKAQINQMPGFDVTLNIQTDEPIMSVDRQVTLDYTQVLYDSSGYDWNQWNTHKQDATKWTHTTRTVEKWKTPRDSSGKATGKQIYSKEVEIDKVDSTTVPINKIVGNHQERLNYETYRDYKRTTLVWNSAQGESTTWSTWHDVGYWDKVWKWWTKDYQRGTNWDKSSNRVNQAGSITSQSKEHDYNDRSALTDFWGNFVLTKIGSTLDIKVHEIGANGLQTNNVVLDETFNIPNGFDAKVGQIAYFFGKAPIHEDKITKTTPAKDDTPASYQYVKGYTDDFMFVSTLYVNSITTADAIKKAHTIIHAGDSATIDTETENVYINGALANQYLSPASTYPLLKGGSQEQISFYPTADKANVKYTYRPAMK